MVERIGERSRGGVRGILARAVRAVPLMALALLCAALAQAALYPEMTQSQEKKNGTVVDIGHADEGYIWVSHKAGKKKLKARVSCGKSTYTYDLNNEGEFEVFPLQMGSGTYKVAVFEQVKGTKYQGVSTLSFKANVADEYRPYLYPNQYAWYEETSQAVSKGEELCAGITDEKQKLEAIRSFVTSGFMYDYMKATNVKNAAGYLPVVDNVLSEKKGICFDFAALMCCMLRTQGIPTQLVIGYADGAYHAWNRVYVDGQWRLVDTTAEITGTTVRQYTTERIY